MKDIKVLIRIDESKNKFGFVIVRDTEDRDSVSGILRFISLLDILKNKEMQRLEKKREFKFKNGL